jgi:hypothetical protein
MKLTADLIQHSSQYLNSVNEFHLDLRGMDLIFEH